MVVAALNGDSITFTRAVIGNATTAPANPTQLSDVVRTFMPVQLYQVQLILICSALYLLYVLVYKHTHALAIYGQIVRLLAHISARPRPEDKAHPVN